ncbi:hypothetical protein BO86DRAFT_53467 [Aspergillus japonicus CBS 114.51]|uniref:Uncharacterized protein n=1 Tax=Aspergillus japonicus CBS 114.51 TaxID=1448312 RepID=A0A8T8X565_ASPJA|nr:hypothetical protein BO86DRAFT_53467 [Aspergillus japonicus CBS 114.51]RAH83181.1 hypothetical protein BO86DRAFT_53467 [Aspergillus japonicus CBS 114.51]
MAPLVAKTDDSLEIEGRSINGPLSVGCHSICWVPMDAMRMGAARVGGDHGMETGGLGKVPDSMQVQGQCQFALDHCDTPELKYSILLAMYCKILMPPNGYWKTSRGLNFRRGVSPHISPGLSIVRRRERHQVLHSVAMNLVNRKGMH